MKRVIVILCDSLKYDDGLWKNMKFLKRIKNNSIVFNNYYSKGPYTEAALNPLLSGTNTIEYNGYINNLKERPYTINEVYKNSGYKTFNTLWFYPNTKSFLRGVDEYIYVDSIKITHNLAEYRLDYFKELNRAKKISKTQIEMIIELIEDFFSFTQIYIYDYLNKKERFKLLSRYTEFEVIEFDNYKKKIEEEKEKFYKDKYKYIEKILIEENNFFEKGIYKLKNSNSIERKKLDRFIKYKMVKQFIRTTKEYQKNRCVDKLKITLSNIKNQKKEGIYTSVFKWFKHTINHPVNYGYKMLTANEILEEVGNYIIENKEDKIFTFCHIMDNHYPFNFSDIKMDDEFSEISRETKDENVFYEMSKKYVDKKIENFVEKLRINELLEDTLLIITADHGTSYSNEIFRDNIVSNFYDENYKVPLIIYNPNINGEINNNYGSSIDFIPTICDISDIKMEKEFQGKSLLKNSNKNIFFEYLGSGCPDSSMKNIHIANRSERYKVCYIGDTKKFNEKSIVEIYNLEKDPKELNNLINEEKNDEIRELIEGIKERINQNDDARG